MVSIKDIAGACGVSTATVSKALNNRDDVNPATKERVQEVAKQLGYLPNAMARALKTKKTYNIGVLMVDKAQSGLKHHYFASILDSFKVVMERNGYDLTFISNQIGEQMYSYYEHCMYRNIDGVLAACVDFNTPEMQLLLESKLPVVSIDYISDNGYAVVSDNGDGVCRAVEYALAKGHTEIAYIYGEDAQVTEIRKQAFRKTLATHHCEIRNQFVRQGKYLNSELAYQLTQELLTNCEHRPTCILYPDDICAVAGIAAITDNHLETGKDISVIGYDGNPVLQMLRPKLTTIWQDTETMGLKAAELMMKLLRKEQIPQAEKIIYCESILLAGETVAQL
ncbi:MAG: LacI family transcriptional regulator [Oscillospiraceae bacterium]|nr:LacI family transcriptional regulator [Oscillospiraceae bacterium]MDE6657593.1 LacI family transcriptional regulator [Oscillospiraceae bacterium]